MPLTTDEVDKCRLDLIRHYHEVFSEIKTDVLNPLSRMNFEDIYTSLYMLEEVEKKEGDENCDLPRRHPYFDSEDYDEWRARKLKQHLPDDDFRKLISPGQPPYRILLIGEAGVGKTTFLAKLTHDWMTERDFKTIELLIHIPLRQAKKTEVLGDIVQQYLSDMTAYGRRLDKHIKTSQHNVMFLLDGLDEFDGDIPGDHVLAKIMSGEKYKECVVIITTRPWRADKIIDLRHSEKKFTFVSVEGFTKENMKNYVDKFFQNDEAMALSLKCFLDDDSNSGGVFSTIMAPFPIFLAMLCHIWKNEDKRKNAMKLQTVPELTNFMVLVLTEHYALKTEENGKSFREQFDRASNSLSTVGNVVYPHDASVFIRQLVFEENDFADCMEALETVCQVGLVSKDKTVPQVVERERKRTRYMIQYRNPPSFNTRYSRRDLPCINTQREYV